MSRVRGLVGAKKGKRESLAKSSQKTEFATSSPEFEKHLVKIERRL